MFAANKKFVSLMFLAKWTDLDLSFGSTDGIWFSVEQYPGAFEKTFKGKTGYVYSVKKSGFVGDPRLGLQGTELIKKSPAKIEKTEYVPDVWDALQQTVIVFVTFTEYMRLLRGYIKKKARRGSSLAKSPTRSAPGKKEKTAAGRAARSGEKKRKSGSKNRARSGFAPKPSRRSAKN